MKSSLRGTVHRYRRWCYLTAAAVILAGVFATAKTNLRTWRVTSTARSQGALSGTEFGGPEWLGKLLDYAPRLKTVLATRVTGIKYPNSLYPATAVDLRYLRVARDLDTLLLECPGCVADEDLEFVSGLEQLTYLRIDGAGITSDGIGRLKGLSQLEVLRLENTAIDDSGLTCLSDMPSLWKLRLIGIPGFTGEALQYVPKECRLHKLLLQETGFDRGLEHIDVSELEYLRANRAPLQDNGLAPLCNAYALKSLNLQETHVTGAGLAHLAGLPALEYLTLTRTQVTDEGLEHLANLPALRQLKLNGTRITDTGLGQLANGPALQRLYLSDTQVTDEGVQKLANLGGLEWLELDGTAVTQAGAERLAAQLPHVMILYGPTNRDEQQWAYGRQAQPESAELTRQAPATDR